MVWQEKPSVIVMLISFEQYWSDSEEKSYGPFQVAVSEQQVFADYVIRKIVVTVSIFFLVL